MGTTHVAVGFNDLGTLMYADIVPNTSDEISKKPLRWVGFDISPYACAKTVVVAKMMTQAAQVDDILQVLGKRIQRHFFFFHIPPLSDTCMMMTLLPLLCTIFDCITRLNFDII